MSNIIRVPEHNQVLVKATLCAGLKLNGLNFRHVLYKLDTYTQLETTVEACQRLAAIGIRVDTPLLKNYSWPGLFTPFEHQYDTSDFMVSHMRSFIFNDIGTSKTLSALWADDYLKNTGKIGKTLIASTLSTLNRVWAAEILTHITHRTYVVLTGDIKRRLRLLAEDYDYYIINHEGVKTIQRELENRKDITHVIMDEGARMRNQKTDLWQAANAVCGPESGRTVWWMTGSPMPKAPTDVWAQAVIVNPSTVPKYFNRFRDIVMYKLSQSKWVPKKGWEDTVYSSLKPAIRYKREDCVDLPECQYIDHIVEASATQKKVMKTLKDDSIAQIEGGLIQAANEVSVRTKLLQAACGAVYDGAGKTYNVDPESKLKELSEILVETGDKLIIFTPFKSAIKVITDWLDKKHAKVTYGIINGDVTGAARDKHFIAFQNGDLNIIVAHPATMAHGLTLTASNSILWWGPIDDFEIYEQANGRITRPGQTRRQYIMHLICSDFEKKVYERLKKKESLQGLLLDMISK